MNTALFKYALEVEKTNSISRAAENLFMAQPNLSKAIKELEESVGFPVFRRTSKGVVPTENGKILLKYAAHIMEQLDEIEKIADGNREERQKFNVAYPSVSYIARGFVKFVREVTKKEKIAVSSAETTSVDVVKLVGQKSCNIGIVRFELNREKYFIDYLTEKDVKYDEIWNTEFLVLMSQKNSLSSKGEIEMKDLANMTEIIHRDDKTPYKFDSVAPTFENADYISITERQNRFELISTVENSFMWVSPMPADLLKKYGLCTVKCRGAPRFADLLIYPKGYRLTATDRLFLNKVYEAKNDAAFDREV